MDAFQRIVIFLSILYGILAMSSMAQVLILHYRDSLPLSRLLAPLTVQQKVLTLVMLLCSVRVIYCLLAITAWDPTLGKVVAHKVSFYALDEFATIFFFSLSCILALFWAELYYIAIDQQSVYTLLVRPATYSFNILAYVAAAVGAIVLSSFAEEEADFTYWYYSLLVSIIYITATIIFIYYALVSARELNQVPILLSVRQQRLQVLRLLAYVFIAALLLRSAVMLSLMGVDIVTNNSKLRIFALGCYFLLLDILPITIAVAFYRVEWISSSHHSQYYSGEAGDESERNSLLDSWGASGVGSRLPNAGMTRDAAVAAIIQRLSDNQPASKSEFPSAIDQKPI